MVTRTKKKVTDPVVDRIRAALDAFAQDHPAAKIDVLRKSEYIVHVRILDESFEGVDFIDRHDQISQLLEPLSTEDLNELAVLLMLTPKEARQPLADSGFEELTRPRKPPANVLPARKRHR